VLGKASVRVAVSLGAVLGEPLGVTAIGMGAMGPMGPRGATASRRMAPEPDARFPSQPWLSDDKADTL